MNRGVWFRTTPPSWTSRTLPSLRAAESHRGRNRKVPAIHSVLLRDRVDNRSTRVNHGRLPGERQDASAPSAHSPDKRSACAARDAALASGCGAWRRPRCGGRTAGPAALGSRSPGGRRAVLAAAMSGVSHLTNILCAARVGPQPSVVARHRLVHAAFFSCDAGAGGRVARPCVMTGVGTGRAASGSCPPSSRPRHPAQRGFVVARRSCVLVPGLDAIARKWHDFTVPFRASLLVRDRLLAGRIFFWDVVRLRPGRRPRPRSSCATAGTRSSLGDFGGRPNFLPAVAAGVWG